MAKQEVALVLSSGGSKGLAHVGVIRAFAHMGFRISSVAGSSIGSLIGGLYAMDQLDAYVDWVSTLDRRKVWGLMDFTFSKDGFLKGERVFNEMRSFIPDQLIEQMRIPFSAVATDIINEKEVVFDSGSFYEAIRASVAIPTAIKPVKYKDTYLVDGGVLCPVPIPYVKRKAGDLLVVVNLYGTKEEREQAEMPSAPAPKSSSFLNTRYNEFLQRMGSFIASGDKNSLGYLSLLDTTTSAMVNKISKLTIEQYKPDITVNIPANSAGTFDFYKANELINLGESLAEVEIGYYLKNKA